MGVFKVGNKMSVGNKGGGRHTKAREILEAAEKITNEALIKLARRKVYGELIKDLTFAQIKDMGLPVALKGITEKSDVSVKGVKINFDSIFNDTSRVPKKD